MPGAGAFLSQKRRTELREILRKGRFHIAVSASLYHPKTPLHVSTMSFCPVNEKGQDTGNTLRLSAKARQIGGLFLSERQFWLLRHPLPKPLSSGEGLAVRRRRSLRSWPKGPINLGETSALAYHSSARRTLGETSAPTVKCNRLCFSKLRKSLAVKTLQGYLITYCVSGVYISRAARIAE